MTDKPVFYDPQRKRWKRFRRVIDVSVVASSIILIFFAVRVLETKPLSELLLPTEKFNYRAVPDENPKKLRRAAHRKTDRKPSEIQLNSGEGLRAAYFVDWDAASYSSLKAHITQIDILFPEWLHMITPDGNIVSYSIDNHPFSVVDANGVHDVDREDRVIKTITNAHVDTEIFPLINNYDAAKGTFMPNIGDFLSNVDSRANFIHQIDLFLTANPKYHGISLSFQEIPPEAQPGYKALLQSLYADLQARHLRLYIDAPVDDDSYDLKFMANNSDGVMLMNFDANSTSTAPGAIAPQQWFTDNLKAILKKVPKEKIICDIGNYGYDWAIPLPQPDPRHPHAKLPKYDPNHIVDVTPLSAQEAWQEASDSDAEIELDPKNYNPHFAYDDDDTHMRHEVWMLDAVTALNEMRIARNLGIQTFSLWVLGQEDQSIWKIWDKPATADADNDMNEIPPGADVDTEGEGDILKVVSPAQSGQRTVEMDDPDYLAVDETMVKYPLSYTIQQYGYDPKRMAITFDDGPDPVWTPKILDILKQYNVKATFLMIGEVAQDNVSVMRRVYKEGHEIGNHTFTHPDISEISPRQVELQLNLTERLFAAKLGVEPVYFRPPYSIDQEPDTNDQAEPIDRIEKMGYIILGDKIDTSDWDEHPHKSPQEIVDAVFEQIDEMKTKPWMRGSIILMHDGGGNRQATVDALPVLIQALRARGYQIVPVCELLGKTRAETMPSLSTKQRWQARVDSIAFTGFAFFNHFVIGVFFVGDVLMSARLIIIGIFAVMDRFRKRKNFATPDYHPSVAVVIPAYNEEKVIVRTIRSVMMSTYTNLRIIVVDDGSTDKTAEVAREAYSDDIASGRLLVLTKHNSGKAASLNYALNYFDDDIFIGIDADTVIAHDAIANLVPHFANPRIAAVAGNAKVGNRVNLWTRWQALEYITSQNFERRALDLFDVVMVVPGAIGAWRTSLVKAAGGYAADTVAEDADLTMNLLEQGYSVIYEDLALAFTEAPINADGLKRQRFRWSFGILQAIFKHRGAFKRHRAMGFFALPNILVFQIILPLLSPFIDFFFLAGVAHYIIDRHFHPEAASAANLYRLLGFFLTFLLIDFATSVLAFSLERRHPASKGDIWLLAHIWLQRFTYRQVFSIVLFKTIKRAIDGKPFSWDKLERTALMSESTESITSGP
jgi:cellulose synthase/poly-beta-1,6-N-acetylglucosamine synthase-like glycosyltransferase/peptidoglycan/xylan/chitin deacetylase (PgdA/CDA1 family)/spore germination protein YaaH